LIIGQGQGGTFYNAFDVTEAGMGVDPELDDLTAVSSLLAKFDTPDESIEFKWSFPNYSHFDTAYTNTFTVTDATPGGRVKFFGDLSVGATYAEKTVGYTWSDPAVGPLNTDRSTNAVIVGSGYFPNLEASLPYRGGASAPKAGNVLYLLDVDTGVLIGNPSGGACTGSGCMGVGDDNNTGGDRKNALQADPTAAGDNGSFTVNKAYLGDIDGKYWKFGLSASGAITKTVAYDTRQPIFSSSALLFIGSSEVYMFFSTGSDLLPSNALGGADIFQLFGLKDGTATPSFTKALTRVTDSSGLATGERPSTAPSVAGDIVFFTTTNEAAATPCNDFTANLYGVTYKGGAAYDANGNGRMDTNESLIAKTLAGRATAPFIVDQHLYVSTSGTTGAAVEKFGDPEDYNNGVGQVGVRILSWREIR
jgi:Tfp pilus tip-associated adhesin PilY1